MDTGQFFWLICEYCCETMCKSSIWSNLFYLGVCQISSQVVNIEWKSKNFDKKKASQIRASQIRASQIRATEISSNHRELHGAVFVFATWPHLSTNWTAFSEKEGAVHQKLNVLVLVLIGSCVKQNGRPNKNEKRLCEKSSFSKQKPSSKFILSLPLFMFWAARPNCAVMKTSVGSKLMCLPPFVNTKHAGCSTQQHSPRTPVTVHNTHHTTRTKPAATLSMPAAAHNTHHAGCSA